MWSLVQEIPWSPQDERQIFRNVHSENLGHVQWEHDPQIEDFHQGYSLARKVQVVAESYLGTPRISKLVGFRDYLQLRPFTSYKYL